MVVVGIESGVVAVGMCGLGGAVGGWGLGVVEEAAKVSVHACVCRSEKVYLWPCWLEGRKHCELLV